MFDSRDGVKRLLSKEKQELVSGAQRHDKDVGSPEVQIELLSARIKRLTEHLSVHKQDKATRYGLVKLVNNRRKLTKYLARTGRGAAS